MNSTNWPAPNVLVFIAQLIEHCRANGEAMGSNPVYLCGRISFLPSEQISTFLRNDLFILNTRTNLVFRG